MSSSIRPHRDQTLVQLVTKMAKDLQTLLRLEIALAKSELADQLKLGAAGGALFAVAGLLALVAFLMASVAAALALALVLPAWAGFLIVAGVYVLIAAIAVFVGIRRFKRIQGLQRTAASVEQAKELVTDHVAQEGEARGEGVSVAELADRRAQEAAQASARDAERAAARAAAVGDATRQNADQWRAEVTGPETTRSSPWNCRATHRLRWAPRCAHRALPPQRPKPVPRSTRSQFADRCGTRRTPRRALSGRIDERTAGIARADRGPQRIDVPNCLRLSVDVLTLGMQRFSDSCRGDSERSITGVPDDRRVLAGLSGPGERQRTRAQTWDVQDGDVGVRVELDHLCGQRGRGSWDVDERMDDPGNNVGVRHHVIGGEDET